MQNSTTYSLPYIEAHPGDFLGPAIVSVFLQALQTGYLVAQIIRFCATAHREPCWIRVLVTFVSAVGLFQTATFFWSQWKQYVIGFADWIGAVVPEWPQNVQPIMTIGMAAPVQGFLIWRCYHVMHRRWLPLVPLVFLLIGSIIASAVLCASTVRFNFKAPLLPGAPPAPTPPLDPTFIISLLFPAVLDVTVTAILLVFLLRARSGVYTKRLRRTLMRLVVVVWEAAVPPSACAVLSFITYVLWRNINFWDLTFQAVIGKLYVISLLSTLCARASISLEAERLPTHFPTLSESTHCPPLAFDVNVTVNAARIEVLGDGDELLVTPTAVSHRDAGAITVGELPRPDSTVETTEKC